VTANPASTFHQVNHRSRVSDMSATTWQMLMESNNAEGCSFTINSSSITYQKDKY